MKTIPTWSGPPSASTTRPSVGSNGEGGPKDRDRLLRQLSFLWLDSPENSEEQLGTITDPVLVIAGDRNEFASLVDQARLYRTIPGAELGIMPGSSHSAIGRPLFWTMIEDFLDRLMAQDRAPATEIDDHPRKGQTS